MKSMAKRSALYYTREGLLLLAMSVGLTSILAVEMVVLNLGEDNYLAHVVTGAVMIYGLFVIMFHSLKNMYAANWTDSIVLSMGARRKDIFWGEIVKAVIYSVGALSFGIIVAAVMHQTHLISYLILMCVAALPTGAFTLAIGYKIRRFGKVVIILLIIVMCFFGGVVGALSSNPEFLESLLTEYAARIAITVVGMFLAFTLLELWVYRLTMKSSVS